MSNRPIDRLVKLASKNICDGVREEPRLYFDRVTLDLTVAGANGINGDPRVFENGEPFPVRITKMIMSLGLDFATDGDSGQRYANLGPPIPQAVLAGIGTRIRRSDEYYMNNTRLAIPTWVNTVTTTPYTFGTSASSWTLDRPVALSVRDYLEVEVQALASAVNFDAIDDATVEAFTAVVSVTATGVGMQSGMPYFLGGEVDVSSSALAKINTSALQNTSAEPIWITDLSAQARFTSVDGQVAYHEADMRMFAIGIRQLQNGTRTKWLQGPTLPTPVARMPAALLGVTSGMSLVHVFPGDGIQLEPAQSIRIEAEVLAPLVEETMTTGPTDIWFGLAGFAMVT